MALKELIEVPHIPAQIAKSMLYCQDANSTLPKFRLASKIGILYYSLVLQVALINLNTLLILLYHI